MQTWGIDKYLGFMGTDCEVLVELYKYNSDCIHLFLPGTTLVDGVRTNFRMSGMSQVYSGQR